MAGIQDRKRLFYASASMFPEWSYPSRYAVGMNLKDFRGLSQGVYTFRIKGKLYKISKEKAFEFGMKYVLKSGPMPNLIPFEELTEMQ